MSRRASIPASWFDAEYTRDPDPWRFASSAYERAKYADTLETIGDGPFATALEIGCSIGVFTALLAPRCSRLFAVDASEVALERAREANPGVDLERMRVPDEWPDGSFDLIVLSEVLYYLEFCEIDRVAAATRASLRPAGRVVLVHWTGATDYPCSGDEAADRFVATSGLPGSVTTKRRERYRLDRCGS